MPTCNFYHFLVSFASQASPEDIHAARRGDKGETKGETTRSEETGSEAKGLRRERRHVEPRLTERAQERWRCEIWSRGVNQGHHDNQCSERTINTRKGRSRQIYHTVYSPPRPKPSTGPYQPDPPINPPPHLQLPVGAEPESSND